MNLVFLNVTFAIDWNTHIFAARFIVCQEDFNCGEL